MLSRVSQGLLRPTAARLAVRTMPRALCAVAETETRLVDEIRADIADMTAKIAGEGVKKAAGYSAAEFEAAMNAGTVDPSMVNDALEGFPDEARKVSLARNPVEAKHRCSNTLVAPAVSSVFLCDILCAHFCLHGAGVVARASSRSSRPSPPYASCACSPRRAAGPEERLGVCEDHEGSASRHLGRLGVVGGQARSRAGG